MIPNSSNNSFDQQPKGTPIPANSNGITRNFHFDEDIKEEIGEILKTGGTAESKGLFLIKTASHWIEQAQSRPIPQMLFGEFWFEGECKLPLF